MCAPQHGGCAARISLRTGVPLKVPGYRVVRPALFRGHQERGPDNAAPLRLPVRRTPTWLSWRSCGFQGSANDHSWGAVGRPAAPHTSELLLPPPPRLALSGNLRPGRNRLAESLPAPGAGPAGPPELRGGRSAPAVQGLLWQRTGMAAMLGAQTPVSLTFIRSSRASP